MYRNAGQARFDCDICDLDELAKRHLADYAAVCLLDPTPLEPAVWKKLADYAAEGHGVAIFLGRNAQPIDSFNAPQAQELLPGKLLRQVRRPDGDLHLAPARLSTSDSRGLSRPGRIDPLGRLSRVSLLGTRRTARRRERRSCRTTTASPRFSSGPRPRARADDDHAGLRSTRTETRGICCRWAKHGRL